MAYQANRSSGSMNRGSVAQSSAKTAIKKLFSTGLFAPKKEGSKSLGSVQVKEDILIPAGSYLNLFENERKTDAHPVFNLSVTEGVLKKA